jgi:hypothetical protein
VVRRGRGIFSDLFRKVGGVESPYSHVGILHLDGDEARVIHTVASELTSRGHVRIEPLRQFIGKENADAAALYRARSASREELREAVRTALGFAAARVPFDTRFDLATEDRLYCTELVQLAFRRAGVVLVKEDQLVALDLAERGSPLMILSMESLLRSERIQLIWTLE